jgi:hypothetical protein
MYGIHIQLVNGDNDCMTVSTDVTAERRCCVDDNNEHEDSGKRSIPIPESLPNLIHAKRTMTLPPLPPLPSLTPTSTFWSYRTPSTTQFELYRILNFDGDCGERVVYEAITGYVWGVDWQGYWDVVGSGGSGGSGVTSGGSGVTSGGKGESGNEKRNDECVMWWDERVAKTLEDMLMRECYRLVSMLPYVAFLDVNDDRGRGREVMKESVDGIVRSIIVQGFRRVVVEYEEKCENKKRENKKREKKRKRKRKRKQATEDTEDDDDDYDDDDYDDDDDDDVVFVVDWKGCEEFIREGLDFHDDDGVVISALAQL